MKTNSIESRIKEIDALGNPTELQKTLSNLYKQPDRTESENQKMQSLLKEDAKIEWFKNLVKYIDALKNPTESQKLLSLLSKKSPRTEPEEKQMQLLVKAEIAARKLAAARNAVSHMLNTEKKAIAKAERTARNHEMMLAAGLMSHAGLLDKKTGKPLLDRGVLLGALVELSGTSKNDERWHTWKQTGDRLLATENL